MEPTVTRARLRDNSRISGLTFWRVARLRTKIEREVEGRRQYVDALGLDPEFCFGAANWGDDTKNDFLKAYEHIRDGDRSVLNHLRFFCQAFSGYSMMSLQPAHGLPSVRDVPKDFDAWIEALRPEPDIPIKDTRELQHRMPALYRYAAPRALGEIGWCVDGTIYNYDAFVYQERIAVMWETGVLDRLRNLGRRPRILEIGGGYGALARALRSMLGASEYVICDLPESLMFSGLFLRMTTPLAPVRVANASYRPGRGFTLLSNYKFHQLLDAKAEFDLAINTISMSEMSESQVRTYATGLRRLLGTKGIFYEQNVPPGYPGAVHYCKDVLPEYFPRRVDLTPSFGVTQGIPTLWSTV